MYQYAPRLRSMGIELQLSPLLGNGYLNRLYAGQAVRWPGVVCDYLKRVVGLLRAGNYDLIWIEKELFPNFPAWFEEVLRALGIRYVIDIDDAVFHNYGLSSNRYKRLLAGKIGKIMRNSALVICGNDYLAEWAHSAGAPWVETIPTVIDLERYDAVGLPDRGRIVVGWCGSPSTAQYLEIVAPALRILAKEIALQLRVIGAGVSYGGLDVDCRNWSESSEAREIQDFDIGIMPLRDSPWERGKCGYKLIQYMACGKPVIATSSGANEKIVVHGRTGYLVSSLDDWVEALRALMVDSQKRWAMGMQGRDLVENNYCVQVTAPRIAQLLRECVGLQ